METFDNAREALRSTIRRSGVMEAVNRALVPRKKKTRAEYLNQIYKQSRSSYTRERLSSLKGYEEPEEIKTGEAKPKRNFSLPNISAITGACLRTLKENTFLGAKGGNKRCPSTSIIEESTTKQRLSHSCNSIIAETAFQHFVDDRNTMGKSNAKPKGVKIFSTGENHGVSPSRKENVKEVNTCNPWMRITDTTMHNFLVELGRKVPNAYVLDLLSHRFHNDSSDNTNEKSLNSDTSADLGGRPQTKNYPNPLHKRVIMIGKGPTISPHPRRRFCTKMKPTIKDRVMLMRKTAPNLNFYSKGNVIGVMKFALRLLPISECLKIKIESVHFFDEYKSENEHMHVTVNITRDGMVGAIKCVKTNPRSVPPSKQVHFNEEVLVKHVGIIHFIESTYTFRIFCYTEGISRTQRCIAEAYVDLKGLRVPDTGMRTAPLVCV